MSHWLEEAEKKVDNRTNKQYHRKDRVVTKKSEVKKNKDIIGEDYLDVIDEFVSIIQRINNLPKAERVPFGQISSKHKENKLDNLLHKFSSSRRVSTREYYSFLKPFKIQRYKNSRSFFISISRKRDHVLLEYKEVKAKKVRLEDKQEGIFSFLNILNMKKKANSHDVIDNIVSIPLSKFNREYILEHIDWLAFKSDSDQFLKQLH